MKKISIISIILIGIFSFILVGCSNGDKKANENKQSAKSNIVTNRSFSDNSSDANSIENKNSELNDKTEINKIEVDNKVINKDMGKKSLNKKKSVSTKKTNNNVRSVKSKSNTVKKPSNKKSSLFKIGMSMNEVRAILKKNNIKIDNEIEVTSTTSDPAWGNKEFWTKDLTLQFDKKTNKLCLIEEVKESKMRTALGLVQGDSIEKMKKLYGNKYKVKSSGNKRTYAYKEKNGYFNVYEENGKVMWWSFSN